MVEILNNNYQAIILESVMKHISILPVLLTIVIFGYNCRSDRSEPLIAKDLSNKNEKKNTLFVFVGEKIEVKSFPEKPGAMDAGFKAKYKILQKVYGNFSGNYIEFVAYDHYGEPPFAKFNHVLLFVSEYEGKFYHEKYTYDPLFKTKDGRWAGPYSEDYRHPYNDSTKVVPVKIIFEDEVSFPIKTKDEDGSEFTHFYPEPYFKKIGDKAVAIYGNYIEELFKLKKDGVLTARQLFGTRIPELEADVELENIEDTTETKPR
jgi:hypothetical protein